MKKLLLPSALLLIAGCADNGEPVANDAGGAPEEIAPLVDEVSPPPPGEGTADPPTIGGDGSPLELAPVEEADIADLSGELACSFVRDGQAASILIGRGDVASDEPARAAIRIGGYPERLIANAPGYGAMERGARFAGRGMTVTIERQERVPGGGEQLTYRATLLAQRADGAERRFAGLWRCGP